MIYRSVVTVERKEANELQGLLEKTNIDFHKMKIAKDATIKTFTAKFEDGCEADIKVCSGQHNCFADPVLFNSGGHEICVIEPAFELLGEYIFEVDDNKYIVELVEKLSEKAFCMHGYGGTDVSGEWHWNGSYYTYLRRGSYGLNHNYMIDFYRNGRYWDTRIYVSLTAVNSAQIKVYSQKIKGLKVAKAKVVEAILEYDKNPKAEVDIRIWCEKRAYPVFVVEDGQAKLIGTTYSSVSSDVRDSRDTDQRDRWMYYNDDIPKYSGYRTYYTLERKWNGDGLYISRTEFFGTGSCTGGIEDEALMKQLVEIAGANQRYCHLFEKNNELKESV